MNGKDSLAARARLRLEGARDVAVGGLGLALVAMVAVVDYSSGIYVSFSLFYLIPITLVTWFGGRPMGISFAALCAVVWGGIEHLTGAGNYPHVSYIAWNATLRAGFFLVTTFLLSALQRAHESLAELTRVDELTGLANRRAFTEILERELQRAGRTRRAFTLAYVDLDGFKQVNDTQGHAEGDAVLRAVGAVAAMTQRAGDVCARIGGDEFALLLPETNVAESHVVVRRFHETLAEAFASHGWRTGASIGAVTFKTPPRDVAEALRHADDLAREVKAAGKGTAAFAVAMRPAELTVRRY